MKIVVISSIFQPYRRGGAEVLVELVVSELVGQGHEVVVCTTTEWRGFHSLWPRVEQGAGITIYRWFPINLFSYLNIEKHSFGLRMLWHLIDMVNIHSYVVVRMILRRERPDLVLGHVIKGLGYLTPRAVMASRVPYIQTLHDVQLVVPSGLLLCGEEQLLERGYMYWYRIITRWLCSSPQIVLFPSRFLAGFYSRYGFFLDSKSVVVPNPVGHGVDQGNHHARVTGGGISFLYVGQLESAKGVQWLVEILSAQDDLNWRLIIAGSGSLEVPLRELATKDSRISLVGRLGGEALVEVYRSADFLVVPSLCYENDPLVIGEALSVGTPVIAADIGGVGERVIEGKNGLLFNAGSMDALVNALERAERVIRSGEWQAMSDAARMSVGDGVAQYITTVLDQTNTP